MQPLEVTGDAGQRRAFQGTDRHRDQGGQIVAVAPPGRPLQHGSAAPLREALQPQRSLIWRAGRAP